MGLSKDDITSRDGEKQLYGLQIYKTKAKNNFIITVASMTDGATGRQVGNLVS